ncbi:MAG: permease [Candidatus Delongbacteria bacterium]
MNWRAEGRNLLLLAALFLGCFYLPVGQARFDGALVEALELVKWYAREHVLLCLVPAFFIAGAISVFVSQGSVMRYLGPQANRWLAYGVASVSGTVLAVCSCTVLPLFAGIHRMGAGLGPATAFLYSGPAINVLAIVMTARVLGLQLGVARAVGAIVFSLVIGLLMHLIFRKDEEQRVAAALQLPQESPSRPLWQNALFFFTLSAILVFATWSQAEGVGLWSAIGRARWTLTSLFAAGLGLQLALWFGIRPWKILLAAVAVGGSALAAPGQPLLPFSVGLLGLSLATASSKGEAADWFEASWGFAKQIMPLLLGGVFVAGLLLGRPGHEGLIPNAWVAGAVGGNSLGANLFSAVAGAFMYFATLTEIPILQGLLGSGMGQGPALALLLAGPALSLPSMLVIRSVLGWKKALVYIVLVVVMSTLTGLLYGLWAA